MRPSLFTLLCLLLSVAMAQSTARAEAPPRTALNWSRLAGAESCIDPTTLGRRVEALVGDVFALSSEADFVIEGSVARDPDGFSARIVTPARPGSAAGERILRAEGSDCHALDEGLVFVVALTVDPSLADATLPRDALKGFAQEHPPEALLLAELETAPSVPAQPTVPIAAAAPVAPPVAVPPVRRPPRKITVGLGAALAAFDLPATSWGIGGQVGTELGRRGWWLADLRAYPAPTVREFAVDQRLSVRAYEADFRLCGVLGPWGSLRILGCGGVELHYLDGRGSGFMRNYHTGLWLFSVAASVSARLAVTRQLGVMADLSGHLHTNAPRFVAGTFEETRRTAFTPGRLGLSLLIGPYVEF